jgi:hypothetical protein
MFPRPKWIFRCLRILDRGSDLASLPKAGWRYASGLQNLGDNPTAVVVISVRVAAPTVVDS